MTMGVALQKTKLYFKGGLIAAVLGAVLTVLVKNRANRVSIWFFHEYKDVNVVWLLLMTALATLISAAVLRMVFRLFGDWRRLAKSEAEQRRTRELDEQAKRLDAQAQELQTREKRVDAKIERSLSQSDEE